MSLLPWMPFESIQLPRSTMDECVEYIVTELDQAASELKFITRSNYNNANEGEYGRVTKGIALAFKAQTLLHCSKPALQREYRLCFAQESRWRPTDCTYPMTPVDGNGRQTRIKRSSPSLFPACTTCIKENDAQGSFSPYLSCRNVMLTNWNSEWIWGRPSATISIMQYARTPYHSGSANEIKRRCRLRRYTNHGRCLFHGERFAHYTCRLGLCKCGFLAIQSPGR